jgi:hypothetical protein
MLTLHLQIECSLDEYKDSGKFTPKPFTEADYLDSYNEYERTLVTMDMKRPSRFAKIQTDILKICW